MNLFDDQRRQDLEASAPLAERMRAQTLAEYVGQEHLVAPGAVLRRALEADQLPSMILWGPPGSGKTTLARLVAKLTKARFIAFSAVTSGVKDVREVVQAADERRARYGQRTVLFVDEIHRFNRAQQDAFLPHIENGTITLIGATTENPSFELNSALLSRCRVFVLNALEANDILVVLKRALDDKQRGFGGQRVTIADDVLLFLAEMSNGDARTALNALELAVASTAPLPSSSLRGLPQAEAILQPRRDRIASSVDDSLLAMTSGKETTITVDAIKQALQRTHLLYDRQGEEHYNIISALHKSMRGSDADAALYWLGRMLEAGEDPLYVARRLVRFASEDIGLADPQALLQAVAAYQASHFMGMPECNVVLAQCVAYLARAPKSNALYVAYGRVQQDIRELPAEPVPLHLRNAPTGLMRELGYGKDYKYTPTYKTKEEAAQDYLPKRLRGRKYLRDEK